MTTRSIITILVIGFVGYMVGAKFPNAVKIPYINS